MRASNAMQEPTPPADRGLLRFLTCGSVDDGKSTLIGRLLVDTRSVLADALSAIERTSRAPRARGGGPVAAHRRPAGRARAGDHHRRRLPLLLHRHPQVHHRRRARARAVHPQHGDRRLDRPPGAHPGGRAQGRRHPDPAPRRHRPPARHPAPGRRGEQDGPGGLVGGGVRRHRARRPRLRRAARHRRRALPPHVGPRRRHGGGAWPPSSPGTAGRPCSSILEAAPAAHTEGPERLRFPVQWVCRPHSEAHHDFRGFAGRVESGEVAVGDEVQVLPSGRGTRVAVHPAGRGRPPARPLRAVGHAGAGGRGGRLAAATWWSTPGRGPEPTRSLDARSAGSPSSPCRERAATCCATPAARALAQVSGIAWRVDLAALERVPADGLAMNDIGRVRLRLAQPIAADRYADNRSHRLLHRDRRRHPRHGGGGDDPVSADDELALLAQELEGRPPAEILAAAAARHPGRIALACSFGAEDCLLVDAIGAGRAGRGGLHPRHGLPVPRDLRAVARAGVPLPHLHPRRALRACRRPFPPPRRPGRSTPTPAARRARCCRCAPPWRASRPG